MDRFSWQKLLWVLSLVAQLVVSAPQGNGGQFPDNYSVYVRALQNQNQPAATPSPYSTPIQPQNHGGGGGGYSPPLIPQSQPYRPPLIPHIQPDFNHHHQGNYGRPQPNILQPSQQPPQQPQVRNFPQYQPPLSNPFKPAQPSQPQHNQHNQHNNNQQVIYVGGQQSRPYNPQASQPPVPLSNSGQTPHQHQQNGQPSFSTSFTSDAARQGKVVSGQAPAQAIQKAPASEIQFDKGAVAKDKDASNKKKDDEYVIYYYYYYDDENKKKENNLTLNFDDIPNLEQYDSVNKTQGGRSNVVANGVPNSLQSRPAAPAASHQSGAIHNVLPGHNDYLTTSSPRSATAVSVSVSVSEGPQQSPVPNVYRYGNSEIPRSPIIKHGSGDLRKQSVGVTNGVPVENHANTVVSVETKAPLTEASSTTPSALHEEVSEPSLEKPIEEANDVGDTKKIEVKKAETPEPETTTTTTEATTTEEPTTTTETSRRPGFGNRRRYGGNGGGSNRISPTRRPATSSTTTEAAASSTRRTPRPRGRRPGESSRIRPTRPRGRTTPAPKEEEEEEHHDEEAAKTSTTTQEPDSTTATSRRFGATSNRRFTPSRTGSRSSTTPAPTERSPVRPITPRPRPGGVSPRGSSLFGRTRPPGGRVPGRRPPFSRAKPVVEEKAEEEEDKEAPASSSTVEAEEASKTTESGVSQSSTQATSAAAPEVSEPEEGDKEESEATEAPASSTTEASRRNPLFRTRTRAPLFSNNRARPNPLSRSRPTAAPSK